VFLEKLRYYDLTHDVTSFSPERASHPALQLSVWEPNIRSRRPSYRLHDLLHMAWEWNELDRVQQLDAAADDLAPVPSSLWMDSGWLYEDMCLAYPGFWTGGHIWRNNNCLTGAEEPARADGPDTDGAVHVRAHGEGIEGRPMMANSVRSYRNAGRH
jgi:hypothetical protein